MPKRIKKNQNKKGLFNGGLVKLAAAAVFVGCAALIVSTELDCTQKEKEQQVIQAKIDEYEAENSDLQNILDSGDLSGYMERVAIEERGYAYPDERRFYDTSRD